MAGRADVPGAGPADADFADYLHARWPRLVGALEAEGVPPDDARLAVAEVMVQRRRGWARLVREQQVDVLVWRAVRDRLGLPPGDLLPPDVATEPPAAGGADVPEDWLPRAEAALRGRRRRGLRRGAVVLATVVLLLVGLAWWDARPDPPAVRSEQNPLPVTWYAAGELHLDDVVVEMAGVDAFAESHDGVVVRHTDGRVVLVRPDGRVEGLAEEPDALAEPPQPPPYEGGPHDVVVQSVPLPEGGWAHLVDSSRRPGEGETLRLSESGRRAVVVCSAEGVCGAPQTVLEGTVAIRLG